MKIEKLVTIYAEPYTNFEEKLNITKDTKKYNNIEIFDKFVYLEEARIEVN